jgi:hypothetical protein
VGAVKVRLHLLPISRDLRDSEQQARQLVRDLAVQDAVIEQRWRQRVDANVRRRQAATVH